MLGGGGGGGAGKVGGLSKSVGRRKKKIKKHWLKRPKAIPQKTKFGPKYKWFEISYLEFFFWKYYFGRTTKTSKKDILQYRFTQNIS